MGSLCNQRLHPCRIQSLLRGPEASSPGYSPIAAERLPTGVLRRCKKYPGARSCLSIAHFWGRGKGKCWYGCHILAPLPTRSFPLPFSSRTGSHLPNSEPSCVRHSIGICASLPRSQASSPGSLWVGKLLVRVWRMRVISERGGRTGSNQQGLPFIFLPSGRTQTNYLQTRAGERSCLSE